ncbi:Squalene synthase [Triticum urartu]|uniref:Squalene synthase n=1 Tax=Triticum urartu TaxID=4572 RepID=M8B0M6_TRIUA|nr:Squalene synthase [Triticum urartu]
MTVHPSIHPPPSRTGRFFRPSKQRTGCRLAEDDTAIPNEVKLPILRDFYRHIYNPDWLFSCGANDYRVLMDNFRQVSTAFLELGEGHSSFIKCRYQKAIEEITRRMGAGMAKFICTEVETIDDYDEYCHYVAGLVGYGLSRLFHATGTEDLAPDHLSNSMGLFLQKTNIIRDYLEDINEIPRCRMFWPREIWSKYVDKLEDLKYEENSEKAVQCLNDMVTNALIHAQDCLQYMSALKDNSNFRFCAIPQIMAIGTCAICYNNVKVFRGVVKMRRGLTARVIDETKSISDVYSAFYEFSSLLESKLFSSCDFIHNMFGRHAQIDDNDPNAALTRRRVDAIKKTCKSSGLLKRRGYDVEKSMYRMPMLVMIVLLLVAIILGVLYGK